MKVFYLGLYTTQKPLTNLKGRVGDRVGSSPTSRTKKTFGSFFVGGTLCFAQQTLCVWNPHCVAGARLRWSFSGVKLTLDCMSHQPHQKDLRVFFCWWDFVLCTTNALRLEPTLCGWRPSSLVLQRSQVNT